MKLEVVWEGQDRIGHKIIIIAKNLTSGSLYVGSKETEEDLLQFTEIKSYSISTDVDGSQWLDSVLTSNFEPEKETLEK